MSHHTSSLRNVRHALPHLLLVSTVICLAVLVTLLQPPVTRGASFDANSGLFISDAEIAALPTSGSAWSRLKSKADANWGQPDLSDQNLSADTSVLAGALVYAKTKDVSYRQKVHDFLLRAIGTDNNHDSHCDHSPNMARSLAIARNLPGFVIAADLIGLQAGPWRDYVDTLRFKANCPNNGRGLWHNLSEVHDEASSNGNALAGAARIAAALYMGDSGEVEKAWQTFQRYAGNPSVGPSLSHNSAGASWALDPSLRIGVNPKGAVKNGINVDGAIPNDQGRGGSLGWPPGYTQYPWEGIQGFILQAELLHRAGYPAFAVSDRAVLRTIKYQEFLWRQTGDGSWYDRMHWTKWIAALRYPGQGVVVNGAGEGRNWGWSDWTHGPGRVFLGVSARPSTAPSSSAAGTETTGPASDNAVFVWDDAGFSSALDLRRHLKSRGVRWEAFLRRHPAAADTLGLVRVHWGGRVFYTKRALAIWLYKRGISYRSWAGSHPDVASTLSAQSEGDFKRMLVLTKAPRLIQGRRVAVRAQAVPGSRIQILVRDLQGSTLGRARTRASKKGRVVANVRLSAWDGQSLVRITTSVWFAGEFRRKSIIARL